MGRGWKGREVHAGKSQDWHEGTINGNSGEDSEKRKAVVKVSIFLQNTQIITNRK